MTAEIIGIIGLVVIFAIAMWRKVNMGAVALVVAFLLGTFYFGLDAKEVSSGFPGDLLVTLVGVTFFFGLARANGTVGKVVNGAVGTVSGRAALVPWVFFLLAAIITGSGAISAATNSILIPVGLAFATRYRINPVLIGLSIINGTNAGGFSPLAVYYSIVNGVLHGEGITVSPLAIFLVTFGFNLALNIVVFFIFGGRALMGRSAAEEGARLAEVDERLPWTVRNTVTVVLFALILIGGLFFGLDVGFLALAAAVILGVIWPAELKEGMAGIGWGVVLLIGGIITYVAVLQGAGVVDTLSNSVVGIGSALIAGLLMMYVAGIVSAFASTNAMFGVLVPLAAPLLVGGQLPALGFTLALCVAASAVDSSPFSTGGALVVANSPAEGQDRVFKSLMAWGMSMVAVIPVLVWVIFLVL